MNAGRAAIIHYLAVGTVVVGLFNWWNAVQRRTSDRYVAALGLLGADSAAKRVNGIHWLERVVQDDPLLHAEVIDILAALVRDPTCRATMEKRISDRSLRKIRPEQDVQAALAVIGRRDRDCKEHGRLRFSDS